MALDGATEEVIALVVKTTDDGVLDSDLVVGDLAGRAPSRELLAGPTRVTGARLSPNGDRLAFSVLTDSVTLASTLYVSDYPELERWLPISDSMVNNGFAWGPDGRLWFVDRTDRAMRVASFSHEPELGVSAIDDAFLLSASFRPERGFAVAPDGRLLMIRSAKEAGDTAGPGGWIHVIVGWADDEGLWTE